MKIVFLDFDGVLNNDKFFHLRLDELTKERDHKWSLLKFFDIDKIKPEQIHRVEKVKYFYTEMSYENVKNFIRIFKNIPDVKIVLSTSWRHGVSVYDWNQMFKAIPNWNFEIIGVTDSYDDIIKDYPELKVDSRLKIINRPIRGVEIKHWLETNLFSSYKYVILDDCEVMLPEQEKNYVRTTFKKGLTMCQEAKIIKILGGNNEC